jgi:YggT family protein
MEVLLPLFSVIRILIQLYEWLIIASVLLSWFTIGGSGHPSIYRAQEFLAQITEPFLGPIRQVLMPITSRIGLDFSPILAILLLNFIQTRLAFIG